LREVDWFFAEDEGRKVSFVAYMARPLDEDGNAGLLQEEYGEGWRSKYRRCRTEEGIEERLATRNEYGENLNLLPWPSSDNGGRMNRAH
jgi:hypothetical protein